MRKRRVYLIVGVVGVVLAGVLVAVLSREREPEFGGKRLSEWVERLMPYPSNATNEADVAIRHIGTNGIPYLVAWIAYEPPYWRLWWSYRIGGLPLDKRQSRANGAMLAFGRLGEQAAEAVPELSRLLNDTNAFFGSFYALNALTVLGKTGLPGLVAGLTNQDPLARKSIANRLLDMGTNALPSVPTLVNVLNDPDAGVREAATNALLKICPQALERGSR